MYILVLQESAVVLVAEYFCTLEQLSWLLEASTSDKYIICDPCDH